MASSFPRFSKLPPEVRVAIWEAALPSDSTPGLYTYNKQRHSNTDQERREDLAKQHLLRVPSPACYNACKEARQVVEHWMKRNKTERYYREETNEVVLERPFDTGRDLFYVPQDRWQLFLIDIMEELHEYEVGDETSVAHMVYNIKHLALPAFTAYYSISNLSAMLDWTKKLEALYVLWDELPKPKGIWEIASYPGPEETTNMHHFDERTGRDFVEEGILEEWFDDMEDMWATSEVSLDFWDEDAEKLKVPHIHVRMKEVSSRC
ncbi:hypothetical protein ACHAP5_003624 [Fusarium lateritium]